GGPGPASTAAARKADVRTSGCHWQTVVHSVFARAEFKGPQDLKGATMAISAPNATPDMIGKAYLAQNDVPASEVKFASLGNDPELLQSPARRDCARHRHLDRVPAHRQERRHQARPAPHRRHP